MVSNVDGVQSQNSQVFEKKPPVLKTCVGLLLKEIVRKKYLLPHYTIKLTAILESGGGKLLVGFLTNTNILGRCPQLVFLVSLVFTDLPILDTQIYYIRYTGWPLYHEI